MEVLRAPRGDALRGRLVTRLGHVGVVVDLADARGDRLAEAVGAHAAAAVHHEREAGRGRAVAHHAEVELRLALVEAVRRSERDGERVHARLRAEGLRLGGDGVEVLRPRRRRAITGGARLGRREAAELGLHVRAHRVGGLGDPPRDGEVLLVGERRGVDHDAGEAEAQRAVAHLGGHAVVEVHAHRHLRRARRREHRGADERDVVEHVVHLGVRDDHGTVQLLRRADHGADRVEARAVEHSDGRLVRLREAQNLLQSHEHGQASSPAMRVTRSVFSFWTISSPSGVTTRIRVGWRKV